PAEKLLASWEASTHGSEAYRMHTSHSGLSAACLLSLLRGLSPPFRRPREGGDPSLTSDAAAAGGEQAGQPGLP
ncbi:MAG: hypothetical protein OXH14_10605, partial [Alphaproteobacteria bacterium]|nr:hypothetical protein [Alphaproteobacteria bacterium]